MRKGYKIVSVLGVAAVAALAWHSSLLDLNAFSRSALLHETVPASRGTIRRIVATSGPVRANVTVSVGSQLSGQIEDVSVDFNSTVKPGDVLAILDDKTYAARVAQARADHAVAEAALANQEAALVKARSTLNLSERTIERQKVLSAKGFASTATLDQATRDMEIAKADMAVAAAQIESAKATIEQRKAQLRQAEIDLERTVIRSPVEGTVISRTVDPGQTVAASLQAPELFKIAEDLSRIRIEAQVNEADVGAVSEGNPATFGVDAYPDRRFTGRVTQIRLAATEINNVVTYTVIVEAENEDRRLFPGMTANVEIEAARKDGVLRVGNDVFRFRPREEPGASSGRAEEARSGRSERMIERLTSELSLNESQQEALRKGFADLQREQGEASAGRLGSAAPSPALIRQRVGAMVDKVLGPTLDEEQRRAFESWKRGREETRAATLWVLGANGEPQRRSVRTGLTDDRFTEIVGGEVAEGEPVIVRAREVVR